MLIELPDSVTTSSLSSTEIRLEVACALYARGFVGKVIGAEVAGVDFFAFQAALAQRQIACADAVSLEHDVLSLERLFPG